MRTGAGLLQTCGSCKMMAMVRTSLQKVVVFLHRLQRMAISSPRYQKLCKVRARVSAARGEHGEFIYLLVYLFWWESHLNLASSSSSRWCVKFSSWFSAYQLPDMLPLSSEFSRPRSAVLSECVGLSQLRMIFLIVATTLLLCYCFSFLSLKTWFLWYSTFSLFFNLFFILL